MSNTAEAIGYKADVKSRMKESVSGKKDSLVGTISDSTDAVVGKADSLVSRVSGIVPDAQELKGGAAKVGLSKQNPIGFALVGVAAGFAVGTLLPRTTTEDRTIGPLSDQVTEKAKEAAEESFERGKAVAQDALGAAVDTAQDRGQQEMQAMSSNLHDKAQELVQDR